MVRLSGTIQNSTGSVQTVALITNTGAVPAPTALRFTQAAATAGAYWAPALLGIQTSGAIELYNGSVPIGGYIGLDGTYPLT